MIMKAMRLATIHREKDAEIEDGGNQSPFFLTSLN